MSVFGHAFFLFVIVYQCVVFLASGLHLKWHQANQYETMDRPISTIQLKKERNKRFIKAIIALAVVVTAIVLLMTVFTRSVDAKDLLFSKADNGAIQISINAVGNVVPAFEEIITTPVSSRILEAYRKAGDSVEAGDPILKLDLQNLQSTYSQQLDEQQIRRYKLNQLKINNRTQLSDLQMALQVNTMKLNRMKVEYENERYLDSLGSGTTEKVRQAHLNMQVAELELRQQQQRYVNEQQVKQAEEEVLSLETSISEKQLQQMQRTLSDAEIRSPRKAILTFINTQLGAPVNEGEQVAVISDLSHFRIDGEVSDLYGNRIRTGSAVKIKTGDLLLDGNVSNITPLSKKGVINFTVQLRDDSHPALRSGLKTDLYVMQAVRENITRIRKSSYYMGPGDYELFVVTATNELTRRRVRLGESNYEYVEVVSGISPGEEVVVSDLSQYKERSVLKLKR